METKDFDLLVMPIKMEEDEYPAKTNKNVQ